MARLVVEGQTMMRHDDGALMLQTERTLIGEVGVQVEIIGIGSNLNAAYVTSTNAAVIRYELDRAQARERTARINRSVTPIFKTEAERRASKRQQVTWDPAGEGCN